MVYDSRILTCLITLLCTGMHAKYSVMSMFVCPLAHLRNHRAKLLPFLCFLPVATLTDGVAICHVLPVLWMTSCSPIATQIAVQPHSQSP